MRNFLRRRLVRIPSFIMSVVAAILAFLKWETSVASIPGSIGEQTTKLVSFLGSGWAPIVALFIFSALMFGLWLGPNHIEDLAKWVTRRRQNDAAPTSTSSSPTITIGHATIQADQTKEVARAENKGPVILGPQEPGYHVGFNSRLENGKRRLVDTLIVPYKFNGGSDIPAAEPIATIEVEDVSDIFIVVFSYEVRSPKEGRFRPRGWHQVWLEVRDSDKTLRRRVSVPLEQEAVISAATLEELFPNNVTGDVAGTWGATVSSSHHLHGLPKGVYGLSLKEEMARDWVAREYRNMRLPVITPVISFAHPDFDPQEHKRGGGVERRM